MSLTGALLSMFLVVHAAGNSTTFFGPTVFNSYASKLHALGILVTFFEISLLVIFALHIMFGITLFFSNRQARPIRYQVVQSSGGSTPGSKTMPYTGLVILVFIAVHLVNFHFGTHTRTIAELVKTVLSTPHYALIYIIGMTALGLHISHGFWSLLQTAGINHPKYNSFLRKATLVLTIIVTAVFTMIPLCALLIPDFLS